MSRPVVDPVLAAIRSRRVVRAMTAKPVDRAAVETVLDAARWASTAGNRHLPRFVATTDPESNSTFGQQSPIGRPAQPAELAPAFVFLASPESSYITGEVIAVTGGEFFS